MDINEKPSEFIALLATIHPSAQAAGTLITPWVPLFEVRSILALIQVGTFGALSTVDATIQQAMDTLGTGAKAIGTGKAIVPLQAAGGNNVQALINVQDHELDAANGFGFVQLAVTVGTAATETAACLLGTSARYEPASAFNATSVTQVIL